MKSFFSCLTALAAATLVAAEPAKTIKVVGLESDADNATVVVSGEGAASSAPDSRPQSSTREGAASSAPDSRPQSPTGEGAASSAPDSHPQSPTGEGAASSAPDSHPQSHIHGLMIEGLVIPPPASTTPTLESAIRNLMAQAGKQIGTVSSNGIDRLTMPYQQLGDGKTYQLEWRKALLLLLSPVGYNFTEDGDLVLFGLAGEVDRKHQQLAQGRLTANRTPILFTSNAEEGGMELRNAIREVSVKAGVTIATDYMEPADLRPPQPVAAEGKLTAEEIGKAKQPPRGKRTTFDTNGQQVEWRVVLREILNPFDYDFIELDGVVRIAKTAKIQQWAQEALAKKPLTAKVIRLYHADPEEVVKRVLTIKGLLKHPNASLQATRKKDDDTDVLKNLNTRIQTGSGTKSGMSDNTSQLFNKLIRPRTVPAVVAYDIEENIPEIEAKIKLFDIKEKQILIEAVIFQLDTNNGEEKGDMDGVQWKGFEKVIPILGSIGNVENLATEGFRIYQDNHSWIRTGHFDFQAAVQLIREKTNSKVLASPMVVVGDHSEAAIQVSDVMPVFEVNVTTIANTSTTQQYSYDWNMIRSGTLLWVSPEITESGSSVRMTVHPQVVDRMTDKKEGKIGGTVVSENYELKMHEMDTRATVPSGATLLFGGLIDNKEEEVENKVRWLGDIPVLGWFFRSKTKKMVQKNLMIMIRPTILEDTDQTGFEANALKEAESVGVNSGRNLKKAPLEGPYSVKEIRQNVKRLYDDRVVKPFQDEAETNAVPTDVVAPANPIPAQ